MLSHWSILLVSFGYLALLFAVAYYADKRADQGRSLISNPYIYTFSIAVYCTGWTFYGSVGRAAATGVGFLPIYLGPTLAAATWWLALRKIIHLSKANHITSIADFVASRYGKSSVMGGLVTVISVVGIMPYIALQLKAISASFNVLFHHDAAAAALELGPGQDTALYVALILAVFSILFGTRHIDVTERHEGLVAAIAFESIVKLLAFSAVGLFVTFVLFDGPANLFGHALSVPETAKLLTMESVPGGYATWFALTFISMCSVMFLPRQFQILVVENVNVEHVRTASWLFPLYLLAINLFVLPIAFAGLMIFPTGTDADMFVLTLPMTNGHPLLALFVFVGGLSAATGMVIVETIALSTMLCNDFLMPILLRLKLLRHDDMGRVLLNIRRVSIVVILMMGYLYFRLIGESYALVTIGLVSFAAAAQFAPAILLGIYWKGASRRGALAGLAGGFAVWAYTLMLPSLARSGWLPMSLLEPGPFGIHALGPYHLFGLDGFEPITHSVFWSMLANVGLFTAVSLWGRQTAMEQLQGAMFVDVYKRRADVAEARLWLGKTSVRDLRELVSRMIGAERAERAFRSYAAQHSMVLSDEMLADESLVSFAERELAGTVGAASARVMVSSVIEGEALSIEGLMKVLDETSQAIEYSHRLEEKSRELEAATLELKRTNERLKELDRLKDEFVSTVSHELRTPLTSIRAFSEILQDDEGMDPQQRSQLLRIVVKETERLTRLVNQVLDFTKIESGSYQWAHQRLDLVSAVQESLSATSQLAHNKDIAVTHTVPDHPVHITGDQDRLVQVLINLISNAIKYCPAGTGAVHVALWLGEGEVRLEVLDNGPGIEPSERQRIFEKFHQLTDPSGGKPQGTGLGLTICKTIIDNHGGRIWVEDGIQAGAAKGARFIISLPLHEGTTP